MKLLIIFYCCLFFSCSSKVDSKLPEFSDESAPIMNSRDGEPSIEAVYYTNREIIHKILKNKITANQTELRSRLVDVKSTPETKLLSAGVLACLNDQAGQEFLIRGCRDSNEFNVVQNHFWILGHLEWFLPYDENNVRQKINMKWAEPLMLEMLTKQKYFEIPNRSPAYDRRDLAIYGSEGNFIEILAKMKSEKLYPILIDLWESKGSNEILIGIKELEDRRAIPMLLEILKSKKNDGYRFASSALVKMNVREAIPILLNNLNDSETYYSLSEFKDERILPALIEALPNLNGFALGSAKLLIIELNAQDKLPQLLSLANDPSHKNKSETYRAITKLKDARSIPFALELLITSPRLSERHYAIDILMAFPQSAEGIKGLIDILDFNFQSLAVGKEVATNNNEVFKEKITKALNMMTKQSLKANKEKWLEYYHNTYKLIK